MNFQRLEQHWQFPLSAKEHRAVVPWKAEWAMKGLSLLIKCNERTSFTVVTLCQTTRLTSKVILEISNRLKGSFANELVNRSGDLSEWGLIMEIGLQFLLGLYWKTKRVAHIQAMFSIISVGKSVYETSLFSSHKSQSTLVLLFLCIILFSCTDDMAPLSILALFLATYYSFIFLAYF